MDWVTCDQDEIVGGWKVISPGELPPPPTKAGSSEGTETGGRAPKPDFYLC